MRGFVASRWFPLVDLGCASAAAAIWAMIPGVGWRPLAIALPPLAARVAAGKRPLHRTPLDLPLLIFVLTAAVGVWAAYDRGAAWEKFWLIVAAVLVYFAVARQPRSNHWMVAGSLSLLSALLASWFLLTYDWGANPAKLAVFNRLAWSWMAIRPSLEIASLHANMAGGLLAVLLPFPAVSALYCHRNRQKLLFAACIAMSVLAIAALLLSSSRGAMVALAVSTSALGLWGLSGLVAGHIKRSRGPILAAMLVVAFSGIAVLGMIHPAGLVGLADSLPGPASARSRLDLANATIKLIADFPFTGGGLNSFPGLYSQYIMVTPFFLFGYSHNLLLDVGLEQGLPGLSVLLIAMLASAWLLVGQLGKSNKPTPHAELLTAAILVSLAVTLLHGLVDDALYAYRSAPLLFVTAGMTIATTHGGLAADAGKARVLPLGPAGLRESWKKVAIAGGFLVSILFVFGIRRPLASRWYANLGAIEMARVELEGWPTGKWDDGRSAAALAPPESSFKQAVQIDPKDRTAHHRLGLIAMLRRDFEAAECHLERAYQADNAHRGIRKSLAYSHIWSGNLAQAIPLLNDIPEARDELATYVWWWGTQGREDLAGYASQMGAKLEAACPCAGEKAIGLGSR